MLILVLGFAFERKGRERERKREREERKKRLEFGSLAREIKWVGSWTDGSRSERSERKEIKRLFDLNLPLFDFKKKKKNTRTIRIYSTENIYGTEFCSINVVQCESIWEWNSQESVVLESECIHVSFANGHCVVGSGGMGERRGDGKPLAYLAAFNARLDYCVFALHSEFIHAKIILRGIFFFFFFFSRWKWLSIIPTLDAVIHWVTDNPQEWKLPIIILSLSIW